MQLIKNVGGVEYINDSASTNINHLWNSLTHFTNGKTVTLIKQKNPREEDYSILTKDILKKVNSIIIFNDIEASLIHQAKTLKIETPFIKTHNLTEAVEVAHHISNPGNIVLFSPGCPIFGLFKNYEERGFEFPKIVKKL